MWRDSLGKLQITSLDRVLGIVYSSPEISRLSPRSVRLNLYLSDDISQTVGSWDAVISYWDYRRQSWHLVSTIPPTG